MVIFCNSDAISFILQMQTCCFYEIALHRMVFYYLEVGTLDDEAYLETSQMAFLFSLLLSPTL